VSIWTDVIAALETAADGMTSAGIYNNDYDNINEYRPASKTYPSLEFTFPDSVDSAHDEIADGIWLDSDVFIDVIVDNTVSDPDQALDEVLEDIKRMFETEHDTLQAAGMVEANIVSANRSYTNVRARPAKMRIIYKLSWRVKRSNPAVTI